MSLEDLIQFHLHKIACNNMLIFVIIKIVFSWVFTKARLNLNKALTWKKHFGEKKSERYIGFVNGDTNTCQL